MNTINKYKFLCLPILLLITITSIGQNINKPNKMGPLGTEVNTSSGNLYIPRNDIYVPARGFDINLSFYYNAFFFDTSFGFGKGWTCSYGIQYKNEAANGKTIFWGDGREEPYTFTGGNYVAPKGFFNNLTQYQPNKFLLAQLDGTKYYFDNATHRKITKLEEPNGNFINFNYTDSSLTSITNTAGQSIALTYNANGTLATVVDAITAPTRTYTYTYDSYGNLTKVKDPLNGTMQYTYLVNGPMKTMSDKNNNTIDIIYFNDYTVREIVGCNKRQSYSYDTTTRVTIVTDYLANGNNQITKYEYQKFDNLVWLKKLSGNCCGYNMQFEFDAVGNKIKETDAKGNITLFTYDNKGNLLTVKDALNQVMTYTYNNAFNTLGTYTDNKGNLYSLTYDVKGNLTQLTEPGNLNYTATYNTNGDIISSTDAKGNTYNYNYDAVGNPTTVTGPNGYTATLAVDARGNLLSFKDARNNTTTMQYDILNRLKTITDPINQAVQINYDAEGNVTSVKNQNNETSTFNYDASNRIVKATDAIGNKTLVAYDAMDNLVEIQNAIGNKAVFTYDNLNRINGGTDTEGNSFSNDYDANGNIISMNLPNGLRRTFTYDKLDRLISATDNVSNNGSIQYDANDNITQIVNATGAITNATYDNLNRLKTITDPLGNSFSANYDNNGMLTSVTDRNGNTSNYTYDSTNRVKTYTDAIGGVITVGYDAEGNINSLKDQNNNITLYTYDSLNREKRMTYPDGKFIEYSYDKKSNIIAKKLTDGTTIQFQYDSINRPIKKILPDGHIYTYTYDAIDRLKTATNNSGTVTFTYDNLNRLSSENFDGKTTRYAYDIPNRTQTTIYPDSTIIVKQMDTRNRLIAVSKNGQNIVSMQYNNANQIITKTFSNGVVTNYQYDNANRLTNITTANGAIQNTSFTYDKEGNKKTIVRNNNLPASEEFGYDAAYRMTNYKRGVIGGTPNVTNTYSYDLLGNRTAANLNGVATTYTPNNLNQMTNLNNGTQNINFTYDNNGNQTYNGTFYKKYDAEGRLVLDSLSPTNKILYSYDAFGRRTKKTTNANIFKYGYSGLSQIEMRDGNADTIQTKTVFENFLMPLYNEKSNKKYFYHQNELGSVESISSNNGNSIETYQYDPYGKTTIKDSANNTIANTATGNRFGFTGQELDAETNDYHFYYRNYNTTTGTFAQRDLIGYGDGMGIYQYVGNNPANGVDVLGLENCKKKKKSIDPNSGPHPTFDFGAPTGVVGEVLNDVSTANGVTNILSQGHRLIPTGLFSFEGDKLLWDVSAKSKWIQNKLDPISSRISQGALVTSVVDAAVNAKGRTLPQNADAVIGVVANGLGSKGVPKAWQAVGAAINLNQAAIKAETNGQYGGMIEFQTEAWKKLPKQIRHKMWEGAEDDMLKQHMNNEKQAWNYFHAKQKLENNRRRAAEAKQKAKEKAANLWKTKPYGTISTCPQNGPTGGTQKPPKPGTIIAGNIVGNSEVLASGDPNEIIGPEGQPSKHWVSVKDRLPYTILFENAPFASAPAKYIKISTPIEPKQDAATFQLGSFGFNNLTFSIPPNTPSYYNRLDCRDSLGLYVDITAGYDVTKNEAFWEFQSIDPITLLPPASPFVGLLLLQDSTKPTSGHGFVNFSIKPKANAVTLDTISAQAVIVFDSNDTIPTNFHKNTIDAFAPTSHMNALPATSPNPVTLSWTGTDDVGGCGLKSYTLYVSTNGVSFYILKSGITRTDTTIRLAQDSSYCFFVLATDSVGNTETLRPGEIKCTTISGGVVPVTWLYFNGTNKDKDNLLDWATASELNTKEFKLERSLNSVNFTTIASIPAQGNSNTQHTYNYRDVGIDKLNSAVMYYRIKQIDIDGRFTYSNIVRLNYNPKGITNSIVYPNPTQGIITVAIGDRNLIGTQARLFDVNGRLLQQVKITAQSQTFNLSNLSNGTYVIRLENKETMQIIKQ